MTTFSLDSWLHTCWASSSCECSWFPLVYETSVLMLLFCNPASFDAHFAHVFMVQVTTTTKDDEEKDTPPPTKQEQQKQQPKTDTPLVKKSTAGLAADCSECPRFVCILYFLSRSAAKGSRRFFLFLFVRVCPFIQNRTLLLLCVHNICIIVP